jgi:hypothetical protein
MILTDGGVLYRCDKIQNQERFRVFRFSSHTQSWEPVVTPFPKSMLFGSDRGDLVYLVPNNGKVTMQWYPQP